MYNFYNLHKNKKDILKLLEMKVPQSVIAHKYNVSYGSWRSFYVKYIKNNEPTPKRIKTFTHELENEIIKQYEAGFSLYRIAKNLNLPRYRIARCIENIYLQNKLN